MTKTKTNFVFIIIIFVVGSHLQNRIFFQEEKFVIPIKAINYQSKINSSLELFNRFGLVNDSINLLKNIKIKNFRTSLLVKSSLGFIYFKSNR